MKIKKIKNKNIDLIEKLLRSIPIRPDDLFIQIENLKKRISVLEYKLGVK